MPRSRRPVRPEDLLAFQYATDAQVSPDGARVVFVRKSYGEKNTTRTDLWMVDARAAGEPRPFTSGGKDGHPRWSPDGARLAFIGGREAGRPQIFLIEAGGGEARALSSFPEGSIGTFQWSPDGTRLAVSWREQHPDWTLAATKAREDAGGSLPPKVLDDPWWRLDGDGVFLDRRHALYLVDTATGARRKVFDRDRLGQLGFSFAPDGQRLALTYNPAPRALVEPWKARLGVLDLRTRRLRDVPGLPIGPKLTPAWSPDGRRVAYASRATRSDSYAPENMELWVCDPRRGAAASLTGKSPYCLMAASLSDSADAGFDPLLRWAPDGKRIYARIGWHGEGHVAAVEVRSGRVRLVTRGAAEHVPGNISRDGRRMAVVVSTPVTLPEAAVLELGPRPRVRRLTNLNGPLLAGLELSRPRPTWLRSASGTRVQVWELAPTRGTRKRAPAILEVHGGPHAQYGSAFFLEFQVLCAQGWRVFYGNPRGSKGYGQAHCAAIRGAWGTADWEDVEAVLAHLQSHRGVDAHRLGIMGGSYGGYMTNWAIGHTDAFKAAITDRCVSNLVSMSGTSDYPEPPDLYFPGNAWDRPEARWQQSPLKYLGRCTTPTLIIHSEGDLRCNVEQGEQVFTALQLLGVPTRMVRYPTSTSHGMSRAGPPDLRIHRLRQIVAWWKRWL